MRMIINKPEKGQLLFAEPSIIGDLSFNRSVILLTSHSEEGTIGFILNKPLEFKLNDLIPEIEDEFSIHNGGPVEQDNLYFIHSKPDLIPNSIEIASGIYWGGDFEVVQELILNKEITKKDIMFFLGYSGWGVNQLEDELESQSWVVQQNVYQNKIIGKHLEMFWKEKMVELGGEYCIWSNAPADPSYN